VTLVMIMSMCLFLQASVMRQKQQHESLRRLMDDLKDEMRAKVHLLLAATVIIVI